MNTPINLSPVFFTVPLTGLVLALSVCGVVGGAEPLPLRTLARGASSAITAPLRQVIKDRAAWELFWAKHTANSLPPSQAPAVDFNRDMVIAVTMGQQRTGGYAIEIVRVEPVGPQLRVVVKPSAPRPGAMTIQALTAPFHFVAVPRSDLAPDFVDAKGHRPK
ncbi:MAG: protease complex subunit PrcB family protein [Verrucomicrobia bacterium]|nr:protease complex subunit PrcB family protein [Verrucomicrobiota bacterium]